MSISTTYANPPAEPNNADGSKATETQHNVKPNLFPTTLSPTDTRQGQIGDCTYISAINAFAVQNPNQLKKNISDLGVDPNGNEVYGVKLYENNQWQTVNVTADTGQGATGQNGSDYGPIMEKALAEANGGYNVLNQGADLSTAMEQLTGNQVLGGTDQKSASDEITAVAHGAMGEAATVGQAGYYDPQTGQYNGTTQQGPHDIDIINDHGYDVVGDSNGMVTLENPWDSGGNPWGLNGPKTGDGSTGDGSFGKFTISEQAFKAIFGDFAYTTTTPLNGSPTTASSGSNSANTPIIH